MGFVILLQLLRLCAAPTRPVSAAHWHILQAEEGFTDISPTALYDTEQAACLLTSQRHQLILQSGL